MQVTPYAKTQVRCLRCKGAGCPGCNKQGFKEKVLYQIDGADFERINPAEEKCHIETT
jgi:hypothetical protein